VLCPSWKWLWTIERRVALLSVFIGASVGCTCESGCCPVRRNDIAGERYERDGDALLMVLRLMDPGGIRWVCYPVVCYVLFTYTCVDCSTLSLLSAA
jgi:hypothetical protein